MFEAAFQLLFVPALAQSVGGYLWLALRLRRKGGAVQVEALRLPDLMVCTVLALGFVQIAVLSFNAHTPLTPPRPLRPVEILAMPLLVLTLACGVASFLAFRRLSLEELLGWKRQSLGRVLLWAAGFLLLALPAVELLSKIFTQFLPKEATAEQMAVTLFRQEVQQGHYAPIASFVLAAVFMAPFGEEFFFRGYLYPVGKRYFGATPSAVLSAVLFALMHANVVSFAGLFLLALCLTLAYERTGSLLVPIGMHALFNTLNLALLVWQALGGAG